MSGEYNFLFVTCLSLFVTAIVIYTSLKTIDSLISFVISFQRRRFPRDPHTGYIFSSNHERRVALVNCWLEYVGGGYYIVMEDQDSYAIPLCTFESENAAWKFMEEKAGVEHQGCKDREV